jgi:hypothetical protein
MDGGLDMLSVEVDFLQCHTTLMYIECMQWRVPLRYHEYTLRSLRLYSFSFVFLLPKAPSYALLCVCVCVCVCVLLTPTEKYREWNRSEVDDQPGKNQLKSL